MIQRTKELFHKAVQHLLKMLESLTEGSVRVVDGEVVYSEPFVNRISGKTAAFIVGAVGVLLMFLPIEGNLAMDIGDRLLRNAVMMWNGAT